MFTSRIECARAAGGFVHRALRLRRVRHVGDERLRPRAERARFGRDRLCTRRHSVEHHHARAEPREQQRAGAAHALPPAHHEGGAAAHVEDRFQTGSYRTRSSCRAWR